MQRICCLPILGTPRLEQPLSRISPWLDMVTRTRDDVVADLDAQRHRRFIKTHTPLDGMPFDPRVTYICVARDPRDIAVSWDNHMANADMEALLRSRATSVGNGDIAELLAQDAPAQPASERERFWFWVDSAEPPERDPHSLLGVMDHPTAFWAVKDAPNVILLHYADLKADLETQMRALARRLSIDIAETSWAELVPAASFEQMRRDADTLAPNVSESIWRDNTRFFHHGDGGRWRALFEAGDDARYAARVNEVAAPDVAAWAHHGAI